MSETLPQFLDSLASVDTAAEAIAYAPDAVVTERLTWADLVEQSRSAARKLLGLGVQKGSRVGLLASNRAQWLPLAFGVLRTGAMLVPFSTLWTRDEIAYALGHADVQVLLTQTTFRKHRYVDSLCELVPQIEASSPIAAVAFPSLRHVIALDADDARLQRWSELPLAADAALLDALQATIAPAEVATLFFTSGTTSQAKAVVHSHDALALSARRLAPRFGITPADSWWGHMPLFWSGGFVLGALATLAGRARVVLQENVSADAALELLAAERCTIMAGWHQAGPLLEHPRFDRARIHLRKGTYHALAQRLMGPTHQTIGVYGMSETATCVTAARADEPEETRIGSFGSPLDGMQVKIVDPESGAEADAGDGGEILVKGPSLMEGYYKIARAETFDANGFFHTGDLGFFDARGALHFATRLKDVIKTAGVNVAAVEVEEALLRHPSVQAAHVVGLPDPVRGENVAACVVLAAPASADELRAFCRDSLAAYKVPRHILPLTADEIPKTGSGKVAKAALRTLAARIVAKERAAEERENDT